MSHLMTEMTDADGAVAETSAIPEETNQSPDESPGATPATPETNEGGGGEEEDNKDDEEVLEEEEVFEEEEYYEDEVYEEEEVFEEIVEDEVVEDDGGEGGGDDESEEGETQASSVFVDDSTAGVSGQYTAQSSEAQPTSGDGTNTTASQPHPDPEGFANFADFPPLEEEDTMQQPSASVDHGSTTTGTPQADERTTSSPSTGGPSTGAPVIADEENQQQSPQFVPPVRQTPSAYTRPSPPEDEKGPTKPNPCWYWLVCFLVCGLLGAGAYVGWYLVNEDRKDAPNLGEDDGATRAPTPSPTVGLTTVMDPIQGDCDLAGLRNPHVIDQCLCVGEIQIIADDVRERYESRLETFISTLYEDFDEEISSCSPRNQALVWISSGEEYRFSYEEKVDRFALATFYAALGGTQWESNDNWFSSKSVCEWHGVECDADGMVQVLAVSDNNLQGTVRALNERRPRKYFTPYFLLTCLSFLLQLPPEIALLVHMTQFYAARNLLEGPIPEGLFTVKVIEVVDLSFNALTGPVPPMVGKAKQLRELDVEGNRLSGRISQELAGAISLEMLMIGSNQLVGSLPMTLFSLGNLTHLDLGGNELTGTIPTDIGTLNNLTSLTLGPNLFGGEIPTAIGELTNLETLVIRDVPGLAGRLPALYGRNLKKLLELTIRETKIAGNIETDFGDLPDLVRMDLSNNELRGTIPLELGNLGNLTVLDLGFNFLEGPIPFTLGYLARLTRLSLNDNVLREDIPIDLAMLDNLQVLQLDGTLLTGRVAPEICALRDLELRTFVVDCPYTDNDVEMGVICDIPSCCSGCRSDFNM